MKKHIFLISTLSFLFACCLNASETVDVQTPAQHTEQFSNETVNGAIIEKAEDQDLLHFDSMLGKCPCQDKDKKEKKNLVACKGKPGCGCGKSLTKVAGCPCKDKDKKKKDAAVFEACKDCSLACECPEEEEEVNAPIKELAPVATV